MLSGVFHPRRLAALAVALMLGALGACGGDDNGGDVAAYREEANRLCEASERAVEALPPPTSAASFERYLERGQQIARRYDRQFAALQPPEELAAQHRKAVELSKEGEQLVDELLVSLRNGRQPLNTLRSNLPELQRIAREGNALARQMKLPECVTPLGVPGAAPEPA